MTTTDAVLFDIDGTLCEYERSPAEMLPSAFERAGVDQFFSAAEYIDRYEESIAESDDVAEHRERCFVDIAQEKGKDPGLARAVARAYAAERTHSNVVWLDGAAKTLDTLRGEYRLAAVTNGGPAMQSTKLDALGVDCFETVVYAGYDTAAKPDPEPFETALDALGVESSRALYVGNSLRSDVAGGHNAGIPVAWLGEEPIADTHPTPEYVLDSPRELLDTLELA